MLCYGILVDLFDVLVSCCVLEVVRVLLECFSGFLWRFGLFEEVAKGVLGGF